MLEARYKCKTTVFNFDILVVGGCEDTLIEKRSYSVELFNYNKKCWIYKTDVIHKIKYFCICTFKQEFYII